MNSKEEITKERIISKKTNIKPKDIKHALGANITIWDAMEAMDEHATNEVNRVLGELIEWMGNERKGLDAISTKYHDNKNPLGAFPHDLQISTFSNCIIHAKSLLKK